ncbi:3-keto-5-aminohexanoate cleavage protein [Allorhizobium sp. BGMRC 0089]|uniref:3-keto-5-aminohexanoate cleavage protein n=1 Tax=Allorhizobium sonneratiae TaxID=2934936 RepID=UPI0020347636|nr:3-keto-5-aminohexanoate cleavage protein [Allorhizobium sonneratiae]MCM2293797.1 3-keto-5-aminohexanoate cleavage protein [Allorhizobium sonneratiae]
MNGQKDISTQPMSGSARTAPVAITVAPNGGRKTKADHPSLPMNAGELAECAEACLSASASMIHLHVRDDQGRHVLDVDLYRAAIDAIRDRVGDRMVVQITTEALGVYTPEEQVALVRALRPEAVSLALRELAPGPKHEREFESLLRWMRKERIFPQIILYDRQDQERLSALLERGVIPADDIDVLYVLGRYTAAQQSEPADLLPFLMPGNHRFTSWSTCAFGVQEAACVTASALLGGHIRIGFENNMHLPDGTIASSNAALIQPVARSLQALGLKLATADTLRERLTAIW